MDRLRTIWRSRVEEQQRQSQYEPVGDGESESPGSIAEGKPPVSAFDYTVFLMLGCAMLWSWNMFMACATYFQSRFAPSELILSNFQSSILAVSCVTNFTGVLYLSSARGQAGANYPRRILQSLLGNTAVFTVLALSTIIYNDCSAGVYFGFILVMVLLTSLCTALVQNGVFAFVNGFQPIYLQAVVTGQAVAGVLPGVAQIFSVLAVSSKDSNTTDEPDVPTASPKSAFIYFMTATAMSSLTLLLFKRFLHRHSTRLFVDDTASVRSKNETISLFALFQKLPYHTFATAFTFAVTMIFPVFTQAIVSVHMGRDARDLPRLLKPDVFIPFSFMLWNLGDFLGRFVLAWSLFRCPKPRTLSLLSILRLAYIPLYYMCNIRNHGAKIDSDLFFWAIQLSFGFTNGWIASNALMSAPDYVEEDQKEASGGYMGSTIMGGLTIGSVASFFVSI